MKRILILCFSLLCLGILNAHAQTPIKSTIDKKFSTYLLVHNEDLIQNFTAEDITPRTIEFASNLNIHAVSSANWCKAILKDKRLTIQVKENPEKETRKAVVNITTNDYQETKIHITQLGNSSTTLTNKTAINVLEDNLTFQLTLTSNAKIKKVILPPWIKALDNEYVEGTHTYRYEAAPLECEGERKGDIVISTKKSKEDLIIPVTQVFSGNPRIAVLSDIHFGSKDAMTKVPRALIHLIAKQPRIDAIFVPGDITDYGMEHQYKDLMSVFLNKSIIPEDLPVYLMMGNHDHYGNGEDVYDNYFKLHQPLNQYVVIKGYPFITISMSGTSNDSYTKDRLDYLSDHLKWASAEFPNKPIFVFTHVPPKNTVYGSKYWGTTVFDEILKQYPQVILITGHSHFSVSDPQSIYQGTCTVINDGTSTYGEVEPGIVSEGIHPEHYQEVTEGIIININNGSDVEVERWDTYNDEEILPRWYINAPHDGTYFKYANRTGGESPKFRIGDKIKIERVSNEQCTLSFPQAKDDENVYRYRLEIIQKNKVIASKTIFSGFYLNSRMPDSLSVTVLGIPNNAKLFARVTALDSYNNASTPIVSDLFFTEEFKPAKGSRCPVADLFDIQFGSNGSKKDISKSNNLIETGKIIPKTHLDKTFNRWAAQFNGKNDCYYKLSYKDNEAIKQALNNGFTLEVLYQPNKKGSMCPLSGQEGGGTGIEQDANGSIKFFAHIGGGYKAASSPFSIENGKYYHIIATYDKKRAAIQMYINGTLVDNIKTNGNFGFPARYAQWFGIGADAHNSETGQSGLIGNVLLARMYSKAVSRDEVFWLHKAVKDKRIAK